MIPLIAPIETTIGKSTNPEGHSLLYSWNRGLGQLEPIDFWASGEATYDRYLVWTLNTKPNRNVIIPVGCKVLLANGVVGKTENVKKDFYLSYFSRIVQHEKYSAMRVSPLMEKRILEHRFVYESHKGAIPDKWTIDHIDNNSWNNDYRNLRALSISTHSRMTAQRQTFRNHHRNPDGSFKKSPETIRRASATQKLPDHLDLGKLTHTCKVVDVETVKMTSPEYVNSITIPEDRFVFMGGILIGN